MVFNDTTDVAKLKKQLPARDTILLRKWKIILHFRDLVAIWWQLAIWNIFRTIFNQIGDSIETFWFSQIYGAGHALSSTSTIDIESNFIHHTQSQSHVLIEYFQTFSWEDLWMIRCILPGGISVIFRGKWDKSP